MDYYTVKRIIDDWDPISLFPFCPDDEYSQEIKEISIINESEDYFSLAMAIYSIFLHSFGEVSFRKTLCECEAIAKKIIGVSSDERHESNDGKKNH